MRAPASGRMRGAASLAAAALLLAAGTQACIFKYGSSPEDLTNPIGHGHWDYAYAGDNWINRSDEVNGRWTCDGQLQSPVHIISAAITEAVDEEHRSRFKYGSLSSNGSNVEIINTGHAVQVEWLEGALQPITVTVALPEGATRLADAMADLGDAPFHRVNITPVQLHVHTPSEHFIAGRAFAAEAHIVGRVAQSVLPGCPKRGCFTVTSVLFELSPGDGADDGQHPFLQQLLERAPAEAGDINYLPAGATLDFNALLPSNRSYVAYQGSLTTPPCTEGVLWHVLLNVQRLSMRQLRALQLATADNNCTLYNGTAPVEADSDTTQHAANKTDGDLRRRALLQEPLPAQPVWNRNSSEAGMHYNCTKLGVGYNARRVQPRNSRPMKAFIDLAAAGSDEAGGLDYYLPTDPHKALAAGAVAGIVMGVLFGSGLTAGALVLAWKMWQKRRRRHQFWGLSAENVRTMEQEYESQFETYKLKAGLRNDGIEL